MFVGMGPAEGPSAVSSVLPNPLQQLLGHVGSSRPYGYSRNPIFSGDPRIHKAFLGRTPADGQLWYLLQKFDCLATETGQACVQHECNQGDDCIHIGAVGTEGGDNQCEAPCSWSCWLAATFPHKLLAEPRTALYG